MTEDLHEVITDVLDRAAAERESVLDPDGQSGDETVTSSLLEAAADANDLLTETDPSALLEALELETLPNGEEPASIPEAIAAGDEEAVTELQQLLQLAKLDEHDATTLGDSLEALREKISDRENASENGGTDEDEQPKTDDSETTSGLTDQLRSSMESSLTAFTDDIDSLQAGLEAVQSELTDEDVDADETDPDESSDSDDGGLLEMDRSEEHDNNTGGDGTRYSTMAPSPSKRADMKGTARFSTMPEKTGSN